jgi:5-hydroxyisourate hydrolase
MKRISTHILDLMHGKPATAVAVRLEAEDLSAGVYRLIFDTGSYFARQKVDALYPIVEVTFQAPEGESHFHIPLLLSPNGYTTYRGS